MARAYGVNAALHVFAASIVTMHDVFVVQLAHAPPQVVNAPVVDTDRVTTVPSTKSLAHVPAPSTQLMVPGADMTVPVPVLVTVSANSGAKVGVTVVFAFSVTLQIAPFTVVQPLQPVNAKPAAGLAVTDVDAPVKNFSEQSPGQVMPVPVTVPFVGVVTVSVLAGSNVALIVSGPFIVTVHVVVVLPVHGPPSQPVNNEVPFAAAVRMTVVFAL